MVNEIMPNKTFKANNLKNLDYACSEYAIKRLTGIDVLKETGLKPKDIGFTNIISLTRGKCSIHEGKNKDLLNQKLDGTILRIKPNNQKEYHSVILWHYDPDKTMAKIEDQNGYKMIPIKKKGDKKFIKCNVI